MIGIDLGMRKVDMVDIDLGIFLHYEVPKTERTVELRALAGYLRSLEDDGLLEGTKWVEAPVVAGARNIQSTIAIAQTSGVVHACLSDTHQVAVASWKKRTVGSGNADKAAVKQWLADTHPDFYRLCRESQDLIDATCIALYGREQAYAAGLLRGLPSTSG
jgi:hypothetical protein